MALSRRDRFRLKSQRVEALSLEEWDLARVNLLLSEFDLPLLSDDRQGPSLGDVVARVSDTDLVELYAIAADVETGEVEDVVESAIDLHGWKSGYVRVFLSHSAVHKEFVGSVSTELAVVGIDGFVAHDAMEYTKPWQAQIEQALRSMQACVAIVHPEFNHSAWCQLQHENLVAQRQDLGVAAVAGCEQPTEPGEHESCDGCEQDHGLGTVRTTPGPRNARGQPADEFSARTRPRSGFSIERSSRFALPGPEQEDGEPGATS